MEIEYIQCRDIAKCSAEMTIHRHTIAEIIFKDGDISRMKVSYRCLRPHSDVEKEIHGMFSLDRKRWLKAQQECDEGKISLKNSKWLAGQCAKWL